MLISEEFKPVALPFSSYACLKASVSKQASKHINKLVS